MQQKRRTRTRATELRRWQAHISAQAKSGLSRAQYCRQHDLSYHAMTYWQRKLVSNKNSETATLVPVSLPPDFTVESHPQIQLFLPGRISVALGKDFSSAALHRLLCALEAR